MPRRDDEFDDDRRPDARDDDLDRRPDRDDRGPLPDRPRKRGMGVGAILLIVGLLVLVCGGCVVGGLIFGVASIRDSANRMKSSNNLKQIGLAMYNYQDINGELPANSYSPDGKLLLSWRVHILPYIEQDSLYKRFKLDEPWDGPNNRLLLQSMPAIYTIPSTQGQTPAGYTHYRGFSSPGAVFDRRLVLGRKRPASEQLTTGAFKDGILDTALVVEAADPIEWTRPDDLDASPGKPAPRMGSFYRRNRFLMLFGDGSVRAIRQDLPETTIRALATHSAGDSLPVGWAVE